jgi:hypothetical protein
LTFAKVRRKNSVYYRFRRRAVGSHSQWGGRNPNALSTYLKGEKDMTAESRKKFVLPCGRTLAASWAALRKCWLGFNIAKSQNNILRMQEFAYRIRKIQNQMGIKPTDFDQDIIDENTAMLIDMEYRSQSPLNQETNAEESRTEASEMDYGGIMTGSINDTTKMPGPRKEIYATYESRINKSCPSPSNRSPVKIDKKASYYNDACYVGHPKPAEPNRAEVNRRLINYNSQCYEGPKHDQQSTANETSSTSISLVGAKRLLDEARAISKKILQEKACELTTHSGFFLDIGPVLNSAIHEDKSCDYPAIDQDKSQNYSTYPAQTQVDTHVTHVDRQRNSGSVKHDENNFAVPNPSQPPVYPKLEGKTRDQPIEESIYAGDSIYPKPVLHKEKACPNWSESQLRSSKKQKTIPRKKSCPYKTADSS